LIAIISNSLPEGKPRIIELGNIDQILYYLKNYTFEHIQTNL